MGKRRMRMIFWAFVVQTVQLIAQPVLDIRSFGAVGNGTQLCTAAIQHAVDSAAKSGTGTVRVPKGRFLSGSIRLASGVELHLEKGAVLLGSTDPAQYQRNSDHLAFLFAEDAHDVSVTGTGTIDGQGRELALVIDSLHHAGVMVDPNYNYSRMRPSEVMRPEVLNFHRCTNVTVKGVTVLNGAGWVTKYSLCQSVLIDGVTVNSTAFWNNDGIDLCNCTNVTVRNCTINSADDGICLKSPPGGMCDSILIRDCRVRSSASAVKFGTDSHGGFRNVRIENITVFDTYRSAIALESVDGGIIENVVVDGVRAVNAGNAFFIRLGRRNRNVPAGVVRNITVRNLTAAIPFERADAAYDLRGPELPFFHNPFPASIAGIPESRIDGVRLENITVTYPGRATKGMAYRPLHRLDSIPERMNEYPEYSMFGELPAWALYVRHAEGVTMENVVFRVKEKDFRPPVVMDDVSRVQIHGLTMHTNDGPVAIVVKDGAGVQAERVRVNGRDSCVIDRRGTTEEVRCQ